jgi:protein disulfide-isomerase
MKNLLFYIFLISFVSCGGQSTVKQDADKTTTPQQTTTATKAPQKKMVQTGQKTTAKTPSNYKAKNEGWSVDLEEAYAESKKTGKPILANFTGSDWCGWCKRLDKSVFHQPGFKKWADDNVVLLELDFPRRFKLPNDIAAQNRQLQQSFRVRGYPTIWLFDADKDAEGKFSFNALGKTGYTKTIDEFKATIGNYLAARK